MSDHVYVDLSLYNNSVSTTDSQPQPLILNDRRASAYIEKCSDYRCSISRFSLSSQLPLIIPQIKLNQPQYMPDGITLNSQWLDTVYSFTLGLSVSGFMYYSDQTFLNCKVMQNRYITQPTLGIQDMNSVYDNPYFYIDSIAFFIKYLVNPTLVRAVASLITNYNINSPQTPAITSTVNVYFNTTIQSPYTSYQGMDNPAPVAQVGYLYNNYGTTCFQMNNIDGYITEPETNISYVYWTLTGGAVPSVNEYQGWTLQASGLNPFNQYITGTFYYDYNGNFDLDLPMTNYWDDITSGTDTIVSSLFINTVCAFNGWQIKGLGALVCFAPSEYLILNDQTIVFLNITQDLSRESGYLNDMLCQIVISTGKNGEVGQGGWGSVYYSGTILNISIGVSGYVQYKNNLVISLDTPMTGLFPIDNFLTINPIISNTNQTIQSSLYGYSIVSGASYTQTNTTWLTFGEISYIPQRDGSVWTTNQNFIYLEYSVAPLNCFSFQINSPWSNTQEQVEAVVQWNVINPNPQLLFTNDIPTTVANVNTFNYTYTISDNNTISSYFRNPQVNTTQMSIYSIECSNITAPVVPCPLTSSDIPYMQHETDGNFQLVYTEPYLIDVLNPDSKANIYMNSSLFYLFNGFNSLSFGFTPNAQEDMTNGKNYMLLTDMERQTFTVPALPPFIPAQTLWYITTEYACCPFWTPIQNISFIASTIPINPLFSLPTIILGDTASININPSNLATANIITDFDINVTTGLEAKSIIQYTPSGEYKWIDLQGGDKPLSELSFYVCWKDRLSGGYHRFMLSSGGSASIRLLFRKKSYYVGDNLYNVGNLTQDTDKIEITRPQVGGGLRNKYYY